MTATIRRSEAEREERIACALQTKRDRKPVCCPNCGSDELVHTFDPDGIIWACTDCPNVFCEAD